MEKLNVLGSSMFRHQLRPTAYILANTNHGSMIVNRFDYRETEHGGYGVGYQLLNTQSFDATEVAAVLELLTLRRRFFGDGVIALDLGANVGVHTIEWAKHMFGWGNVVSVEAQQRIYYALAGNIAINNCFNATAVWAAIGSQSGEIQIPEPDYFTASSFGSLEIIKKENNEDIGQKLDWSPDKLSTVPMIAIDNFQLDRLDLVKLDIEGMEEDAINGAMNSINRHKPILMIEHIKSNKEKLLKKLIPIGYRVYGIGLNFLMVHEEDPSVTEISGQELTLN